MVAGAFEHLFRETSGLSVEVSGNTIKLFKDFYLNLFEINYLNFRRDFLEKLVIERKGVLSPTMKMKLLNINGFAKTILNDYKGSVLSQDSTIFEVPLVHNKEKQKIVNGMLESLKSLLSLESYVKTNVNTSMGFVIDAECCFDPKGNPIAIDKADSTCKRLVLNGFEYFFLNNKYLIVV